MQITPTYFKDPIEYLVIINDKNQIQIEVVGVSHQILKKIFRKKLKRSCKIQVKLKSAKREMFVKS